ncbi:hypothetical protein DFQ01_10466 [Paenibacillus cellulosilyticus]|uniref:Uncharacterized protein n=1 Tax=Paenibacillus cellulosilyticus TaxID=375489 RepID=A0A2V2YVP7_9BACL|nr:hypothetical protein [Paenibacillus cellulosilyticus]PWW05507.1 hypothetical protein DFQ01_10466 [Paenibacillus cellulosilyticus]QKS45455.1 hypothetical protein HUB94_14250 [Paenibacillus cellulosilyticus]
MRIRWIPALVSVAVSALLLFGGWYTYDQFAVKGPLEKAISNLPNVVDSTSSLENGTANVSLTLAEGADLRTVYDQLTTDGSSVLKGRDLKLDVTGSVSSDELDKLWSTVLFDVAQAMETKTYSQIPAALDELAAANAGLTVNTEMDDTNVYITLTKGEAVKYIILPRTPATMGVWE